MPENSTADSAALCDGHPGNCELLTILGHHHSRRCQEAGISGSDDIVNAMAVGLVIEAWRNGPVEGMHGSGRGPDDAAMFAESTALHGRAVDALNAENQGAGLLGFEQHLLDRERPWAGTGGRTLRDLGHGHLGRYARHVRDRTNALLSLRHHTCVADPLQVYLVNKALVFGGDHKGMPGWATIVERIGILLADPGHQAWREDGRGAPAPSEIPRQALPIERLTASLLTAPSALPVEVLEWLSRHFLYCAAPPYGLFWRDKHEQ
jgi:hypothetical protein